MLPKQFTQHWHCAVYVWVMALFCQN